MCVWNVWRPLSLTGAWSSVRDFTTHTHTHPKASGGRRGSRKASNSPSQKLVLLCVCWGGGEGAGDGDIDDGGGGGWGGLCAWQVQIKPSLDTNTSHTQTQLRWGCKDTGEHKFLLFSSNKKSAGWFESLFMPLLTLYQRNTGKKTFLAMTGTLKSPQQLQRVQMYTFEHIS